MGYPAKMLNDDEDVILDLRPHWWFITPATALLVAVLALGVAALALDWHEIVKWVIAAVVVLTLGFFGWTYAQWATTNFVITSDRVIHRKGLVSRAGVEMPLDKINTVSFSQSALERVLGKGDLTIESASDQDQHFTDVRKPLAVQQEINRQIDLGEDRRQDRSYERMSGGRQQVVVNNDDRPSIPDQISQLADLRDQDIISQAEFEAKKADLLSRM